MTPYDLGYQAGSSWANRHLTGNKPGDLGRALDNAAAQHGYHPGVPGRIDFGKGFSAAVGHVRQKNGLPITG